MQTLPKNWTPEQQPVCSDSAAAPAMDVAGGLALGLVTFMGAALESSLDCGFASGQESCDSDGGEALLLGLLVATPFLASASYGVYKGNECERAKLDHHAFVANPMTAAPPRSPPGARRPSAPFAAPGLTPAVDPECDPYIEAWQAETHPGRQAIVYRDMPENCRARITRTVSEQDYEREP